MQLRSGRRLVSPPPASRGDLRRGRPRRIVPGGGGNGNDGEDRISDLPEELILDVLRRLGCARQAARTSVLSRRWRGGLWTELRELKFEGADADALETALARVRPNLSCLHISVSNRRNGNLTGAQITSLLRAADRLAPAELVVFLARDYSPDPVLFEMPCFSSATSMDLNISRLQFTLAPAGEFASLEQLTLGLEYLVVDLAVLLSRCPRLRKLKLHIFVYMRINTVAIKSKSLEELTFFMYNNWPANVVIVAPELKKFSLQFHMSGDLRLSHSAPKLEEFLFEHTCEHPRVGFGNKWGLWSLRKEWSNRNGRHPGVRVHVLSLRILNDSRYYRSVERSIAQEVARILVHAFTDLELSIRTEGHVFGPLLLHLLFIQTSIQRLKLDLMENYFPDCSENCDCDQDGNWRNQEISLPDLQYVEIQGFSAADHEVDFLQLVFRSAPNLKRMNVKLSEEVSPSDGGCQKLHSIFRANATVKY